MLSQGGQCGGIPCSKQPTPAAMQECKYLNRPSLQPQCAHRLILLILELSEPCLVTRGVGHPAPHQPLLHLHARHKGVVGE